MAENELPAIRQVQAKVVANNMAIDLQPEDEDDGMYVSSKAVLAMLVMEYLVKGDLGVTATATLPEVLYELRRRLDIKTDKGALEAIISRIPEQVTRWGRND